MTKSEEIKVCKIIEELMKLDEKCEACKFKDSCFFAFDCLSSKHSYFKQDEIVINCELCGGTGKRKSFDGFGHAIISKCPCCRGAGSIRIDQPLKLDKLY